MSRDLAHEILDRAKAGEPIPKKQITEALRVTGDLAHEPFPGWNQQLEDMP